jgi:hypothetical protein
MSILEREPHSKKWLNTKVSIKKVERIKVELHGQTNAFPQTAESSQKPKHKSTYVRVSITIISNITVKSFSIVY